MSTIRAIVIRKAHSDQIKSAIPIENAEKYLLSNVGDVLVIEDGRRHKVLTDGQFESLYEVLAPKAPWILIKPREFKPAVDPNKDEELKQMNVEANKETEDKIFDDINKLSWPKDTPTDPRITRTTHNKTEMLTLEITEGNYSVAAGLLPQGFTTIPVKDVIGYFVVINDRCMQIDTHSGMVESVGMRNYAVHPDIFHDMFIAVDFAYGDFIHCRRDTK